jgi:FkbM family methyltransferase
MKIEGDLSFRVVWGLLWPLRAFARYIPRGRGFLTWRVLASLVPNRTFLAHVPGGKVQLRSREAVGFLRLVQGSFEQAEIETLTEAARPGTVAIDAGAHVGVFTIPLARAVGTAGAAWAIEPLPENVRRLRANLRANGLHNVTVLAAAASDVDGQVAFEVAGDSAYGSTREVLSGWGTAEVIQVSAVRLDTEWRRHGMPRVSVIKIDVEGAELRVLRGAENLLRALRPQLLIEVPDPDELEQIMRYLSSFDYERLETPGFAAHNHLFLGAPGRPELVVSASSSGWRSGTGRIR